MATLTIRKKTLLGISFTLTLLIICLGISIQHINRKNVTRVEKEINRNDLQRAIARINESQNQLVLLAHKWSESNKVVRFTTGQEQTPPDLKLLAALKADTLLILNTDNTLTFKAEEISESAEHLLLAINNHYSQLLDHNNGKTPHDGIILVNQQPVIIATSPIATTINPQKQSGTIILAQHLNKNFWLSINKKGTFTVHPAALHTAQSDSYYEIQSRHTFKDITGEVSITLTNASEPLILNLAKRHLIFFLSILLCSGGIVIYITQIILDKLVLSRLYVLGNELKQIGTETQGTITVDGQDEIGAIKTNIKEMLNRLDTGQRQREQQDRRFADMIEHSGLIVIAMNQRGEITLFNHSAEQVTGYQREDVLGTSFAEQFINPEAAAHLNSYIEEAVKNNQFTGNFIIPIRTRNTVLRTISWDAILERNTNDDSINFIGFGRDVTEQFVLEQRLQLINTVFENTTEAIMISDADNNIIEINRAFAKLSGYPEHELLGQNPRLLKSDTHDSAFFEEMWQNIIEKGHWEGEIWDKNKSGETYPKRMSIATIKNADGSIKNFFSVSIDIAKTKKDEAKLHHLAYFDSLTGLPNRLSFCHQIEEHLQQKAPFSVAILNICNFKQINESIGPEQADLLLKRVAERLQHCLLDGVFLARMGGDEFSYCVPSQFRDLQRNQILEAIKAPIVLDSRRITLAINLGISRSPEHGTSVDELIKNASIALYSNKAKQLETFSIFHPTMNDGIAERMALIEMLREAITKEEFEVYYQPKVHAQDGSILGAEALIRWHSRDGMIPPDLFIPIAEEIGIIRPIGEWVLREACRQASVWRKTNPNFHMAVNISPAQFDRDYLPQLVAEVLQQSALPSQALELEITEGMIIDNVESTIEILHSLRELGVELSIDDFGTGYSSLSYLTRLPLDILKIDRSFMENVPTSHDDTNVVLSILALARSLNLKVTAEGVETQEHVDLLREHNCDYIQGYFYSRPLPATEFYHYMTNN